MRKKQYLSGVKWIVVDDVIVMVERNIVIYVLFVVFFCNRTGLLPICSLYLILMEIPKLDKIELALHLNCFSLSLLLWNKFVVFCASSFYKTLDDTTFGKWKWIIATPNNHPGPCTCIYTYGLTFLSPNIKGWCRHYGHQQCIIFISLGKSFLCVFIAVLLQKCG